MEWTTLQGRDPFSGDCNHHSKPTSLVMCSPPCKDETRFQGIATANIVEPPLVHFPDLQGRDPFSGDCDSARSTRRTTLTGALSLARTRPAFRGLRPNHPPAGHSTINKTLQGRDPFSGDGNGLSLCPTWRNSENHLQGRDSFSGDGDGEKGRAAKPTG